MAATLFVAILSFSLLLSLPLSYAHLQNYDGINSSRALDSLLQDYAFKAFSFRSKTGLPYDADVPNNLTGIKVSALRLRSGSLRTRGVQSYKEFQIPPDVIEQPYVKRLVMVYHNLANWSENFYPLPLGYSYLAPVLGLLTYNGVNLSASELPELDIRVSDDKPILIKFPDVKPVPYGSVPMCVYFDLHGSVTFDILLPGNVCSTVQQGHFSIVVASDAIGKKKNTNVWMIVAWSLFVGCILLILLSILLFVRLRRMKKIQELELESDNGEALRIKHVAGTILPVAGAIRTTTGIPMEDVV